MFFESVQAIFCLDTFGRQADEYTTRGVMFFMFFYDFYVSMFAYMNRVRPIPPPPQNVLTIERNILEDVGRSQKRYNFFNPVHIGKHKYIKNIKT